MVTKTERRMIRATAVVFLTAWAWLGHSATLECTGTRYERALCWYSSGDLGRAEAELQQLVKEGRESHETLKAVYFLARTKMRADQWSEAADLWVRLFELSPPFYREWNGDFLLGVCRRELGQE